MFFIETVINLIKADANVDVLDNVGRTPLHCATDMGNTETVQYLISAGADVNILDNEGLTALDIASRNDHKELVDILNSAGALSGSQLGGSKKNKKRKTFFYLFDFMRWVLRHIKLTFTR